MSSISRSKRPGNLPLDAVYELSQLHEMDADQQTQRLTYQTSLDVKDILIEQGLVVKSAMPSRHTTWYELSKKGKKLARQCHSWCDARDKGAFL